MFAVRLRISCCFARRIALYGSAWYVSVCFVSNVCIAVRACVCACVCVCVSVAEEHVTRFHQVAGLMLWWVFGIMAQTIAKASSVAACTILFPTFCRPLPFSMLDEMFGNTIRHWVWVHVLHFPLTSFHVNSYVYMAMQRMCLRALFWRLVHVVFVQDVVSYWLFGQRMCWCILDERSPVQKRSNVYFCKAKSNFTVFSFVFLMWGSKL